MQALPALDAQLRQLEQAVAQLDASSRALEAQLSAPAGGAAGAGGGSSAYALLTSMSATLQQSLAGVPGAGSQRAGSQR
jgi:hypothetical protein